MEFSIRRQQRRSAQRTSAVSQPFKSSPAGGGVFSKSSKADRLDLSRQALAVLEELNRQDREARRKLLEAKRKGSQKTDILTKSLKTLEKCRKIAARIQAGDKVPPEDERYLMDHDPDGYKLALAARQPKEKPKEWDSVLEKEDLEGSEQTAVHLDAPDAGGECPE